MSECKHSPDKVCDKCEPPFPVTAPDPLTLDPTASVVVEVLEERERQNAKWGEQNHANGTGFDRVCRPALLPRDKTYGNIGSYAKQITDLNADAGRVTFADILIEEVFEALSEADPAALRAELIQVAAVAVQWVEAIDRGNQ